ncbi:hypothetical protein [Bartonella sp. B1099]|uniref:hypothetical protein n=1 Tax=Bartonella sp. B1099 TaxID=2911422 RepID=UPI0020C20C62|nr:hypothetical protein [Bartonella sp. B1099]
MLKVFFQDFVALLLVAVESDAVKGAEQGAVLQEGCCLKWRDVLLHWEAAVHYWRRVISDIKSFRCRGRATNNVCGRFI